LPLIGCAVLAVIATAIFQAWGPASGLGVIAWLLSLAALGVVVWVIRTGAWRLAGQTAAVGLFGALFVFTVRTAGYAAYDQGDVGSYPQEALIYAQGSPALNFMRDNIEQLTDESGKPDLPVRIDQSGNIWPWPWIMRNHPGYASFDSSGEFTFPVGSIVLISMQNQAKMEEYLDEYEAGIPYTHMWWFPEFYKPLERGNFIKDVLTGDLLGTWRRYFIDREVNNATAGPDMIAYFPKGFAPTNVPPIQGGPVGATPVPTDQIETIGGLGSEPGQFSSPADVAADAEGNLYVVDSLNHRIQKIAPDGSIETAGEAGTEPGQFRNPRSPDYELNDGPWGIAVDTDGNVYVADTWNHRIQKFDPDLSFEMEWGTGELFGPRDLTIDSDGNILVVDTGNKAIRKYDSEGKLIEAFGRGGRGEGDFDEPTSISLAANGDIYVADYWNKRIQHFNSNFLYLGEIEVESWGSQGVTDRAYIHVLDDGRVLATDPANARLIVFDPSGAEEFSWRLPGVGGTSRPIGITSDGETVYISDSAASHIVKVPLAVLLEPAPAAQSTEAATSAGTP
jgi:DNA-binding beta-propeller fold protein YncE